MEIRDLNYWTKRIEEYVNKCGLHLWVDERKRFFKIIPFKVNGEQMVADITFGEDYLKLNIKNCKSRTSQTLFERKVNFFPQWTTKTSIPNFNRMKELTSIVKTILEIDYKTSDDFDVVEKKIKNVLKNERVLEKDDA